MSLPVTIFRYRSCSELYMMNLSHYVIRLDVDRSPPIWRWRSHGVGDIQQRLSSSSSRTPDIPSASVTGVHLSLVALICGLITRRIYASQWLRNDTVVDFAACQHFLKFSAALLARASSWGPVYGLLSEYHHITVPTLRLYWQYT